MVYYIAMMAIGLLALGIAISIVILIVKAILRLFK